MQALVETARLRLRPFTEDDVDVLVDLDSDPDVMFRINGGRPTPRAEIVDDVLPALLAYGQRSDGYGFWAAELRQGGEFAGWFHLRPRAETRPTSRSSATGSGARTGDGDWPPRAPWL